MNTPGYIARVARDLADLIPYFMESRRKDLHALRAAIVASDFERLREIGHRMRGIGASYGFDEVSALGRRIEDSAWLKDLAALTRHLSQYTAYLSTVQIVYEDLRSPSEGKESPGE